MTKGTLDAVAWTEQVDSYVAEMNAMTGRTAPAPLFADGPFSFPMIRSYITPDLMSTYARSIGDVNPLWNDEQYAAVSPWGSMIGPPVLESCLAESASLPAVPPIPGWNAMQGGSLRQYHEPFRPGDVIRGEDVWHGIEDKTRPGKPYRLFIEKGERRYINQHGRVAASLFSRIAILASPPAAQNEPGGPDFTALSGRRYTAEELAAVRADYERELSGEARRGAQPRFWEDVQVGDQLHGGLEGPYDLSDAVSFAGALGLNLGFAVKYREIRPMIGNAPVHTVTGAPRHPIEWHFADDLAQARGFSAPPAFGTQLESMQLHAVTNWMSDEGFITEVDIKIGRVLLTGEVSRASGTVAGKRRDGGRCLVDIDMVSNTLDGATYATGKVTIDLPSRDGYSPATRQQEA